MPVYNERSTVEEAIERALAAPLPVDSRQLVVVDDGSTDGTREFLREREHARGRWAAILDADLEYDPADIGRLLEPLQAGEAEVVFGVRGFDSRSAFSFWYVMGNRAVTMVANVIFDSWLADIMTCHKVMATDVWRSLQLRARGFELEGEITGRVLMSGRRVYEVPITYRARGREDGKKLTGMDAVRVVATLVRVRLRRRRS
jgi:glycosyltransferase involved in cell wall biosynthesis